MNNIKGRKNWIDWMKSIGIFLILYGHLFSYGYTYVYTFSVPLFFFISGYLCKIETDCKIFWRKVFYNLILPMFILSAICLMIDSALDIWHRKFEIDNVLLFLPRVLIGAHVGVGMLWFVYTLILLKIIFQFVGNRIGIHFLILLFLSIIGIILNVYEPCYNGESLIKSSNSILNVCVAEPFFIIGYWTKKYNIEKAFIDIRTRMLSFILCLLFVYTCTKLNGEVWMYETGYGHDFFLFLLGGLSGTYLVYFVSKCLDKYNFKNILIISKGTIVILAFHVYFIKILIRRYFLNPSWLDLLFAFLMLFAFVPIIRIVECKIPIIMGKFRK